MEMPCCICNRILLSSIFTQGPKIVDPDQTSNRNKLIRVHNLEADCGKKINDPSPLRAVRSGSTMFAHSCSQALDL